jgi:hypothetical protein
MLMRDDSTARLIAAAREGLPPRGHAGLMASVALIDRLLARLRGATDTSETYRRLEDSVAKAWQDATLAFEATEMNDFPVIQRALPNLAGAIARVERSHDVVLGILSRLLRVAQAGGLDARPAERLVARLRGELEFLEKEETLLLAAARQRLEGQ